MPATLNSMQVEPSPDDTPLPWYPPFGFFRRRYRCRIRLDKQQHLGRHGRCELEFPHEGHAHALEFGAMNVRWTSPVLDGDQVWLEAGDAW